MPLIIDGGRVPSRWAERRGPHSVVPINNRLGGHGISLALINNMPDGALEDTELQFFELLDLASAEVPVYIRLYSLTGVPRTDRGQRHLNSFYFPFDDLWQNRFDGVIITGTEPHHPNLQHEPYWCLLTQLLDWAERNTTSTVLSCLAAHASVLYCDGIPRHPLPDKKFGVFESMKAADHPLVHNAENVVRFPHSRWNEVREHELATAGHSVLTKSVEAGVDVFVKKKKKSLFVHFQGHPEYGAQTLGKEYRRDVRRFLRHERETYPNMPAGYFDEAYARRFDEFRAAALADRREEMMNAFPESQLEGLQSTWHSSAACVYRNWLQYLASQSVRLAVVPAMTFARSDVEEKRSAAR